MALKLKIIFMLRYPDAQVMNHSPRETIVWSIRFCMFVFILCLTWTITEFLQLTIPSIKIEILFFDSSGVIWSTIRFFFFKIIFFKIGTLYKYLNTCLYFIISYSMTFHILLFFLGISYDLYNYMHLGIIWWSKVLTSLFYSIVFK